MEPDLPEVLPEQESESEPDAVPGDEPTEAVVDEALPVPGVDFDTN